MHRRVDPSGERFSRRTRGLEPTQSSNTESSESIRNQDTSHASSSITSHNSDKEQAKCITTRNVPEAPSQRPQQTQQWDAPSVHSVYSQNTQQSTIDTGLTQTTLFPPSIPYQHPLNSSALYGNQQNPAQQMYATSNFYDSRPPRHPMTHPNIQQTVQHPIVHPNVQQSIHQNSDNVRSSVQQNPNLFYQHQQQVPYHNQMMSLLRKVNENNHKYYPNIPIPT